MPQVLAIATIVALGAGVFAGLGTTSDWRRQSLAASMSELSAHDIRVDVVAGALPAEDLARAVAAAGGDRVTDVETQFVARAPVSVAEDFAAGEIVGVDLSQGPRIDRWKVTAGRDLTPDDHDVVLLDSRFADAHGLAPEGVVEVAGKQLRYVGLAISPEYLNLNTTSGDMIRGAGTSAVMFAPLAIAQELGRSGDAVNVALVRTAADSDASQVAVDLQTDLAAALPSTPMTATAVADDPSYEALTDEINSEQNLFDIFALLILAGAVFAVFNLVKRTVEGQRHDIGISMSLGLPPSRIAIRPLLLAAEITVLGVTLGAAASQAIAYWVLSVIEARTPLPVWHSPFEPGWVLRGVALGFVVPAVASLYPVWRAVRVRPVEALQPAHLQAGRHLLPRLVRRVRLPGSVLVAIPLGRVLRAPSRSLLTIAAIAFVMAPLFAAFGATDSATHTLDLAEQAVAGGSHDRVAVDLVDFQPVTSPTVAEVSDSPVVGHAAAGLNVGGYLSHGGDELGLSISMVDLADPLAAPPSVERVDMPRNGLVVSTKAAQDLGLDVGDEAVLRHPRREGAVFGFVESTVTIAAVHASPYRFVAYMDIADAELMGLTGIVNTVAVEPAAGVSVAELQQQMAITPGVASALTVQSTTASMRDTLGVVSRLFIILQVVIAALAFLVAFNTSYLGADERRREHATMFAFGVPIRRVVESGVAESLMLGVIGVALGIGLGAAVLGWLLDTVFPAAVPDISVTQWVAPLAYLTTVGIGLLAAATAPLLNARRLRKMDLPTTLRYVE